MSRMRVDPNLTPSQQILVDYLEAMDQALEYLTKRNLQSPGPVKSLRVDRDGIEVEFYEWKAPDARASDGRSPDTGKGRTLVA